LSLDRIALLDVVTRPATARLLDRLVDAASDPRTAPQADDPADEQLVVPVDRAWRAMARRAKELPALGALAAHRASTTDWNAVSECAAAAEASWFALEAVEPVAQSVVGQQSVRLPLKKARKLRRLTNEAVELRELQLWLSDVAVRAHGRTAFAAGQMSDVVWREAKPEGKARKRAWKKARQPDAFKPLGWTR
jgi:hypothetical protein